LDILCDHDRRTHKFIFISVPLVPVNRQERHL
jgi:hypothetical protein